MVNAMGSLVDSVIKSNVINVDANSIEQPRTAWSEKIKRKLWENENGLLIENASFIGYGIPTRKFYIYDGYDSYGKGIFLDCLPNLGKAKLAAEKLIK